MSSWVPGQYRIAVQATVSEIGNCLASGLKYEKETTL